jgi:aspartate/methionine/tyrosine aminotransferase
MTSDRVAPDVPPIAAFRPVPRTGVIFVTTEAEARGYHQGDSTWCNLGQGQPETDLLPGGAERLSSLKITPEHHEYAPVAGLRELRQAVADFYNRRFRQGMPSQYTWENVAICGGGRLALARAAVALGEVNLGHFLPDYTAYEELLSVFRLFNPIPILLDPESGYQFPVEDLRKEILGRGLLSNPCNPTGKTIAGSELAAWVATARSLDCSLLIDEFYSHYIWKRVDGAAQRIISAAAFVEDVDRDPILLFDGLTKNWRYPGMRVSWTVGPKSVIEAVASAGSFLDGGGTRAAQLASIDLLSDDVTDAETEAIHTAFAKKRTFLLKALSDMGIKIDLPTEGGFYAWGSVEDLGPGLDDALSFFDAALERKVITVPGMFFDINPGRRRQERPSRFGSHLRFSFGPEMHKLEEAVSRLRKMIDER